MKNTLLGQTFAFSFGLVGRQLILYLSLPWFTNGLSQEEFGVVAITTTLVVFLQVVIGPGLNPTIMRLYNDSEDDAERAQIVGATHTLYFIYTVGITAILYGFAPLVSRLLLGDMQYANIIQIIALNVLFIGPYTFYKALLALKFRATSSSIQELIQTGLQVGLALYFVYVLDLSLVGYWIGFTIGSVLGFVVIFWMIRDVIYFRFSLPAFKQVMTYSLPLIPAELSNFSLRLVDRFIIVFMLGLPAAAIYDIGYRIAGLVEIVLSPINNAFPPHALARVNDKGINKILEETFTLVMAFATSVLILTLAFADTLVLLFSNSQYLGAVVIIPWIALSRVIWTGKRMVEIALHIAKTPLTIGLLTIASAVLNFILTVVLIPIFGLTGAAMATFFAFAFLLIAIYLASARRFVYPINFRQIGKIVLILALIMSALYTTRAFDWVWIVDMLVRIIICGMYPVLLLLFGVVSVAQLQASVQLVKRRLGLG